LLTRQIAFEPLPASVLFGLGCQLCGFHNGPADDGLPRPVT
jgi:hypothetical protein